MTTNSSNGEGHFGEKYVKIIVVFFQTGERNRIWLINHAYL